MWHGAVADTANRASVMRERPDVAFGDSGKDDAAGLDALAELAAARRNKLRHDDLAVALADLSPRADGGATQTAAPVAGIDYPRPRVLLVEDNPVNRLLVGVLLDRLGLEHVAVGCGEEAILRMAREPFDAILLDVAMDGLAGLALAKALGDLGGDGLPPLVALGRANLDEDFLQAAGFAAVADAPLDTRRLARALIAALEKQLSEHIGG
ncbi:response regulator receiver domain-containing protein [Tepidamorphus gemmatus]|uniref:Response regulator receiver domain-containing protein n=1 Tax=Tepidamorphus gemmatus TaxID=747076 RepID=A0A4R3MB48_9HYPH|nr:response regulator receiver domain-containing protein [Tepidamorphus gemmatus]